MLMPTNHTWEHLLAEENKQHYFQSAMNFVIEERYAGKTIYPEHNDIFNALKFTPFNHVKAVIIGQDPYHRPNQAHGSVFFRKTWCCKTSLFKKCSYGMA